jgi:prepilin signal peptidase PulO-like enzyme (type II secretory pathway)
MDLQDTYYVIHYEALWIAFIVFIVGACFGSFVTLASARLPREEDIVRTPSHCPCCKHRLGVRDLFPVISWLMARGRCRYCQTPVSIRYPLIEITLGGLFVWLYTLYGLTPLFGVLALFTTILLTMLVADLETGLIPDEIHFALLPLGVAYHWLLGTSALSVLLCAGLALGIGLALHYGYFWLRGKHGLGFGDVKFLLVVGLWLGNAETLVVFLFLSGLLGVVTGLLWRFINKEERFPFGPALAIALFVLVLFPNTAEWFWQGMRDFLMQVS